MHKPVVRTILYFAVGLLIVGTTYFSYSRWFKPAEVTTEKPISTRETDSQAPSPSTDGKAVPNASAGQPDEEALSHLRAQSKLAKAKAGLDQAKSEMEEAKAHLLQSSAMLEAITDKLAAKNLEIPQSVGEAAALTGQLKLKSVNFVEKWNRKVPAPDHPDAAAYHQEMDEIATGMAAMILAAQSGKLGDLTTQTPGQEAEFQSQAMAGALNLTDSQAQQFTGILNRYYAEAEANGVGGDTPPTAGVDNWRQQRSAISARAFSELQSSMTPQAAAEFRRLYSPNYFLWTITIGGQ